MPPQELQGMAVKKDYFWVVVFAQSLYNRVMAFRCGSILANREPDGQIACTVGGCRCILGNQQGRIKEEWKNYGRF